MEEVSAFVAYNANKSKTKKKKNIKPKATKSSIAMPKGKTFPASELDKQILIKEILEQQFKKDDKSKKKSKANENMNMDFKTPLIKKRKISTSTPSTAKVQIDDSEEESEDDSLDLEIPTNGLQEQDPISEVSSSNSEEDETKPSLKANKKASVPLLASNNNEISKCGLKENYVPNSKEIKILDNENKSSKMPRNNSIEDGEKILKWLINPIDVTRFFSKFWEKAPCLIQREESKYYSKLISFEMINKMLLENHIEFTKNIDITKYENGIRETLNPEGRALPGAVWEKYSEGCSIRLLNPQTFLSTIFGMNTTLQEYFHCMVGANVYLTPPNSQGFAPHYDDIEAFVLQIEGKKQWKLYNPRSKNEELPRFSSGNFQQEEIGEAILEKTLEPGHILYFPRGTIHQANTVPGYHSLHITLSMYQRQSYADLCEKLFPLILQKAIQEDLEMRRGLPLHIWNNMGLVHSDTQSNERDEVIKHVYRCIKRGISQNLIDDAVDQLAKKFQHEALPPEIKSPEKCRTVFGYKNYLNEVGEVVSNCQITLENKIRLLRAHILRLVQEEGMNRIYFYIDNSKEYQEYEPNFIEIEDEDAAVVDVLVKSYPDYIYVKDLPLKENNRKLDVCQALWERGLIMLNETL